MSRNLNCVWPKSAHLTLLKTMSTSVVVTFLPSVMLQSLHIFAKFLPFISFPAALLSPCTANLWKAASTWGRRCSDAMLTASGREGGKKGEGQTQAPQSDTRKHRISLNSNKKRPPTIRMESREHLLPNSPHPSLALHQLLPLTAA